MRVLLTICLCSLMTVVNTADVPTPTPQPPPPPPAPQRTGPTSVDAETIKKAEAAADAYLQRTAIKVDPEAELALAEIEVLLLESQAFIEAKQSLKAGEKYLEAITRRKTISAEQRTALGERFRKSDRQMLALSRILLGDAAFDLGDPPAEPTSPIPDPQTTDAAAATVPAPPPASK